ncbi:MAG: hypothetical protein E7372_02250 [Clostridiales bacterium]|nr:hypothetical protein [Clostridiales bacterium]
MQKIENSNSVKKSTSYKVLKIISLLIYIVLLAFLLIEFIPIILETDITKQKTMLVFFIMFILIIIGGIGAILNTIVSLIGLSLTIKNRKKEDNKGSLIFFIIMTILPIFTEIIFFIACKLIS